MKKKKLYIIGCVLCAVLVFVSGFMLLREKADQRKSAEAFEQLVDLVKTEVESESNDDTEKDEMPKQTSFAKYSDVFSQNNDFVGWISIEGTNINYPVMQTKENPDYYLKRNFEKKYSDYGVPYVAESCDVDISDNTVIYGHHMKNGMMFSDLCLYESEDFYADHRFIQFDTLMDYGMYEIVAVFKTVAYSSDGFKYYHFVSAENEAQFDEYIANCKGLALYDTGVGAEYGDKLITISTCEYSQTNGRMVIVAKRVVDTDTGVLE